jgi:hypothetical protein
VSARDSKKDISDLTHGVAFDEPGSRLCGEEQVALFEACGLQHVVRVENKHVLGAGMPESGVARSTQSAVDLMAYDAYSDIVRLQSYKPRPRPLVGRCIVNNDDLVVL